MDYTKAILATKFYVKARLIPIIENKYNEIPQDFKRKSTNSKNKFNFTK